MSSPQSSQTSGDTSDSSDNSGNILNYTALVVALVALVVSMLQLILQYVLSAEGRSKVGTAAIGLWANKNKYYWRPWRAKIYIKVSPYEAERIETDGLSVYTAQYFDTTILGSSPNSRGRTPGKFEHPNTIQSYRAHAK
jgi:hypothetical protein